jgi:ankyrin repeat protein
MRPGGFKLAAAPAADSVRPDGSTPLHWAIFEGNLDEAARLVKSGANVKAVTAYGVTPMQLAADNNYTEAIRLLLKAGADADSPNPDGETALHLVARAGNVEAAKLLLKAGAKVDAREKLGGQTPLMWAAARRKPAVAELLLRNGADVNARSAIRDYQRVATAESRAKQLDRGGFTPLLYAARENCGECVEILLKHKVNVDLPDPSKVAPISIAMINGNWDITKRLIEAGADVNQWDIFGSSPLAVAIGNLSGRGNALPLDQPQKATGREVVTLLLQRGANPNQQNYFKPPDRGGGGRGTTPFLSAVQTGDLALVRELLAHGANPKLATAEGQGAITMAVQANTVSAFGAFAGLPGFGPELPPVDPSKAEERTKEQVELLKHLAGLGADVNLMAHRHFLQRTRGGSALHYAVRGGGNHLIIESLLALGLNINAKDEDGLTALDYAMGRGYVAFLQTEQPPNTALANYLRGLGATVELAKIPDWPPQGPPIATAIYDAVIWPVDPVGP